ncbi:MAG: potassium transporter Kup [Thermoanaerobaculia bacterium]
MTEPDTRPEPEDPRLGLNETTRYSLDPRGAYLAGLSLAALGVVYGDIGTSPLYALRECFHGPHSIAPTAANVMGVLSLIFWSLLIVISVKYMGFILRANNRGEGGILALMSLVRPAEGTRGIRWLPVAMGLFGAALLYGDGMITPAISVLSAIEGLAVATPVFEPYVTAITLAILFGLFLFQQVGTASIGRIFGPLMLVWFSVLALLGILQIIRAPSVLGAVNPAHAFSFFAQNEWRGFLTLGVVFLVVTGGEALYADMGHFGIRPIRMTWFLFVLPALLLNYFGQGALLLNNPGAATNPFYRMGPSWALYPMVALATAATCIASQAVISGAFSLTRQAVQLGFLPRTRIEHTSAKEIGQIYIPIVNWVLMISCMILVLEFGDSSKLASAYGVAVTTDMVFATILFSLFARKKLKWSLPLVFAVCGAFLVVDLAFWGANIVKVPDGGWFALAVAVVVFIVMTTWRRGRKILEERMKDGTLSDSLFLESVGKTPPVRVSGTAVYMDRTLGGTPPALLHNLKHNKVLHDKVVFLTVVTSEVPYVSQRRRLEIQELGFGIFRVIAKYGFMQDPDIPQMLEQLDYPGLEFPPGNTTYFLGRETLLASRKAGMALWREKLFGVLSRNALPATNFFRLPPNRVVELGAQIEL